MSFTQVAVTGTISLGSTGLPATGANVNMTLSSFITDGDNVIAVATETTTCDSTGAFSLTVPANDDPTTTPTGTYYSVVITSESGGSTLDSFTTVVSYKDAPSINLYSLPRSAPTGASLSYGVSSVNGETGAVVLDYAKMVASGTVTLVAGTVSVANTSITANSIIRLSRQAAGGALGEMSTVLAAGTGFAINSSSNTDTSTVYYEVVSY